MTDSKLTRILVCAFAFFISTGLFSYARTEDMTRLKEKAEAGDAQAMNYLGYLLISGEEGVEKDSAEGLLWLIRAASTGDAKAASNLGWLLIEGKLVDRDMKEGVAWLQKAADAGLPVALSLLGDLYRDGNGVAQDSIAADSLYRKAFEGGLDDAGYKLYALNEGRYEAFTPEQQVETGKYYYFRGAPSEGVKLFYKAAERGDAKAMALLGDAYTRAIGVPYDYKLSLKYYVKGALAGNPSAQFILAELLDIFPDTMENLDKSDFPDPIEQDARYWYEKAAEAGVRDAAVATELLLD